MGKRGMMIDDRRSIDAPRRGRTNHPSTIRNQQFQGRVGSSQESIGSPAAARLGSSHRPGRPTLAARQDVTVRSIMARGIGPRGNRPRMPQLLRKPGPMCRLCGRRARLPHPACWLDDLHFAWAAASSAARATTSASTARPSLSNTTTRRTTPTTPTWSGIRPATISAPNSSADTTQKAPTTNTIDRRRCWKSSLRIAIIIDQSAEN